MKFLIIQQKMIGDVLTSTVICNCLKKIYPQCSIDFVANRNTTAVLENNPNINKIIIFENSFKKNKKAFYKFLKTFSNTDYDVVIDAYGKTESNLISFFCKAPKKISYYKWYSAWIYTATYKRFTTPDPAIRLAIKNRLLLLSSFTDFNTIKDIQPSLHLTQNEINQSKLFLKEHNISPENKIVMLSVLGSSIQKTLPAAYMAKIIDMICSHNQNLTILFNYIPSQKEEALQVYNLCAKNSQQQIKFDAFAPSLRSFLGILSQCCALIGNEGGATNMAKALGIPTFSIFAPFIKKEGWSVASEKNHIAVHLKDYKPDLFTNISKKHIIKNSTVFYSYFSPEIFIDNLNLFLNTYV